MEPKYPLFILARDDRSLYKIDCQEALNRFEKIDVEDNLYYGWDENGYPVKITWSSVNGSKAEMVEEKPRLEDLENSVLNYAREYAPKLVFEENLKRDPIKLYEIIEKHIKSRKFFQKFKS